MKELRCSISCIHRLTFKLPSAWPQRSCMKGLACLCGSVKHASACSITHRRFWSTQSRADIYTLCVFIYLSVQVSYRIHSKTGFEKIIWPPGSIKKSEDTKAQLNSIVYLKKIRKEFDDQIFHLYSVTVLFSLYSDFPAVRLNFIIIRHVVI